MTTEQLKQLSRQATDEVVLSLQDQGVRTEKPSALDVLYEAGFKKALGLVTTALKEQKVMDEWDIKAMLSKL